VGGAPIPFLRGLQLQIGLPAQVQLPPRVFRGRLTGMLFDTDKAFLLPSALHGIRRLVHFYDDHDGLEMVIVGHTDSRASDNYNLDLADERAASIAAYLRDQFPVWLAFYEPPTPFNRRWGIREDQHMLSALTDGTAPFYAGPINGVATPAFNDAVRRFQEWSNANRGTSLALTGIGPLTRRELVIVYMEQDGTTLPASVTPVTHACGEFHPERPIPGDVPENRRVEIFLFEGPITPPPPPPAPSRCPPGGCTEQPIWVQQSVLTVDFDQDLADLTVHVTDAGGNPLDGVTVELSGPGADSDASDARGRADFHNLAPGTYALLGRKDGFSHEPTNAVVEGGRANEARLVMHPVTLEILDRSNAVTTFVRFGLWDHAVDTSGGPNGVLRNGVAEAANFIGLDTRRFRFRVQDVSATGTVNLEWKTLTAAGADDDAPASRVLTCVETPAGSHTFLSNAVMLVTDDIDAAQSTEAGLVAPPAPAAETGLRARGASNHRLRRAAIDGSVRADYPPHTTVQAAATLFRRAPEERHRLALRIVNYNGCVTPAHIDGQVLRAKQRWNQLGLEIDAAAAVVRPAPAGMFNAAGLFPVGFAGNANESAAFRDLLPLTPDNTCTIVFVPMVGANAYASNFSVNPIPNPPGPDLPMGDRFFVFMSSGLALEDLTLAHELHHVLHNRHDDPAAIREHYTFNTSAPNGFGVALPDVRIYRRVQNAGAPDPDNDATDTNIVNWSRRRRVGRLEANGQMGGGLSGMAPVTATTGNLLVTGF
jgi:hypothetical protein